MPTSTHKNHNKTNQNKRNHSKSNKPKRPAASRAKPARQARGNPYAEMVSDPCNATLLPGMFGTSEGLLARTKSTLHANIDPLASCGYLLWCPDYTDAPGRDGCCFLWQGSNPSQQPLNTQATPFGTSAITGSSMLTSHSVKDPAGSIINSTIVDDVRCIGACAKMSYFGRMADAAGEIAIINNLPIDQLLGKAPAGSDSVPASVNDIMSYANHSGRLGIDPIELKYRLDPEHSGTFRSEEDALITIGQGIASSIGVAATTTDPRVFGFVWRNVAGDQSFTFDLTKNIEWRAEVGSGMTQEVIRSVGPTQVATANAAVDRGRTRGKWLNVAKSAASSVAKMAFTGSSGGVQQFLRGAIN